jgi:hypothetical protein
MSSKEKLKQAREVADALRNQPKNKVFAKEKTSKDRQAQSLMRQHFDGKMSAREVEGKLKSLGLSSAMPYSDSRPLGLYKYKDLKTGTVTVVPGSKERFKKEKRTRGGSTVGMGPAKITTGGGLGMLKQDDMSKPKRLKDGGEVPAKFKGFSKLPEEVQMKMNPQAAKKYKNGGAVMAGRGNSFKGTR